MKLKLNPIIQIFVIAFLILGMLVSQSIAQDKPKAEGSDKCVRRYHDIQIILSENFPRTEEIFVRDSKRYEKHYVSEHQRTLIGDIRDEGIFGSDSKLGAIEILDSHDGTKGIVKGLIIAETGGVIFAWGAGWSLAVLGGVGSFWSLENIALLGVCSSGGVPALALALAEFITGFSNGNKDHLFDTNLYFLKDDKPSIKVVLRNIKFEEAKDVISELNPELVPPDPGTAPKELPQLGYTKPGWQ
jgi:hypothetical protein